VACNRLCKAFWRLVADTVGIAPELKVGPQHAYQYVAIGLAAHLWQVFLAAI
jgi:hypothetical protein